MAWSRTLKQAIFAGAVWVAAVATLPVLAQNAPSKSPAKDDMESTDGGAAGKASSTTPKASTPVDSGNPDYVPRKQKMSDEELGQLRMLEIKSGAFRDAKNAPGSQTLIGPPLSDREKVQHALNRLSFGPKPGQVEKILVEGGVTDQWQAWAKEQLDPDKIDDSELEKQIASRYTWLKMNTSELHDKYPYKGNDQTWKVITKELPQMVVTRQALSKRQFKEVMAEFWRNHLCVDNSPEEAKPRSWAAVDYEENVIRANVFGKFKNMLFASAKSSAMLDYLDNRLNKAGGINENYAREIMELHTVGADHGYGNADVAEMSKVLTGWNYDSSYKFNFREDWHSGGPKTVMGAKIGPGYAGGEQAIYMLATHRYTADFISLKLCKYLVNDEPPTSLVLKVSQVFQKTEGDLPKVYAAIIFSPEFMDRANYRSKFKTPVEFIAAAARATDAKVSDTSGVTHTLARMGEEVYNCPDPTGYFDTTERWMDAGVLTSRWDYAWDLMRGHGKGVQPSQSVIAKYAAMKADERYTTMVRELIGDDIGDRTRQVLKEANDANDIPRMMSVLLGSPSFQQQ